MRVAAVAVLVLALAGCTLQRGYFASERSTAAVDDFIVTPIARFPAYDRSCQEMPDGSCESRPSVASIGLTAQAPARVVSAPQTIQPQSALSPAVASKAPSSPTEPIAAAAPGEVSALKPDADDRKTVGQTADGGVTDAAIVALVIQAGREAYDTAGHSCPCPYDLAPNGRLCGRHSAHSRPGASMRCFAADVTPDQIANYRAKLASKITASWRATGDADAIE